MDFEILLGGVAGALRWGCSGGSNLERVYEEFSGGWIWVVLDDARGGGLGLPVGSLGGVEKTHLLKLFLGGVAWAFRWGRSGGGHYYDM